MHLSILKFIGQMIKMESTLKKSLTMFISHNF
jgi:hypothetical protein